MRERSKVDSEMLGRDAGGSAFDVSIMLDPPPEPRSKIKISALMFEAWAGLLQRPGRSALTMLGTLLGIGSFVAILGVSQTANGQISEEFNLTSATQVDVKDVATEQSQVPGISFTNDASSRVGVINGVTGSGVWWRVTTTQGTVDPRPISSIDDSFQGDIYAAAPSLLNVAGIHLTSGVVFNAYHQAKASNVVLLSTVAAEKLRVTSVAGPPAVFIDGSPFIVIGIYDHVDRLPNFSLGVILPSTVARQCWGLPHADSAAQMLVTTRAGAAAQVAQQVPLALAPAGPSAFRALAPPDAKTLRTNVQQSLNSLVVLLAAVSTVIGALGIANTSLVAVMERAAEIGLRRSLGARRSHVATQFLIESGLLGLLGGLSGAAAGVWVILGVTWARDWTAVLSASLLMLAPLAGAAVGVAAGIYPAWRAAGVEPAEAVRR